MPRLTLQVTESAGFPRRLDAYIASKSETLTRSRLKNGIKKISVNERPAKLSRVVSTGDRIEIEWEDPVPQDLVAQPLPLSVLFENTQVTVVNKRQGMVTHPGAGNWNGTLVNALLYRWRHGGADSPEKQFSPEAVSRLRPGIVHRLDKDTSGVLITARTPEAESWLQKQFASRRVKKIYVALVRGKLPSRCGEIRTAIVRSAKNRMLFTACDADSGKGKYAHTLYKVLRVYGAYSLVLLSLKTGRTHQLRVHLKYVGCPIVGDPLYGNKDPVFKDATLMLHARRLSIVLPGAVKPAVFTAPLPARFKKMLTELERINAGAN